MSEISSAIIGAFVGFLSSLLFLRCDYRQLFAQTVSNSRMNWIDNFREEFSIFIGTAKYIKHREYFQTVTEDHIIQAEKSRVKLLTRLNQNIDIIGNEFNEVFAKKLNEIHLQDSSTITDEKIDMLISLSREILEPEWQKVKKEAKGEGQ